MKKEFYVRWGVSGGKYMRNGIFVVFYVKNNRSIDFAGISKVGVKLKLL